MVEEFCFIDRHGANHWPVSVDLKSDYRSSGGQQWSQAILPLSGATILQVIPGLDTGGAERTTIEVAEALVAAKATALVASAGGRLEGELTRAGAELIRFDDLGSKNPLRVFGAADGLSRIIGKRKVNLIHARSRAPAWSALWAARRMKIPFVTTYHGVYNARSAPKRLYNSVMARGDVVIANSAYTANHILEQHPFAKGRIVTIPRGVDIDRFDPGRINPVRLAALRKAWGIPEGDEAAIIVLPARMTGWKGHREAVAAAALLKESTGVSWRMVFAGDAQGRTGYVGEIRQLISAHGLDDRIALVGHCDDMPTAFALADIVIAPSNEPEAFGRVAAEAGAMGAPAIVSSIGAQGEIVVEGRTGLIVPPLDPAGLARAMASLLSAGRNGRKSMGEAAIARIREKFTTTALQKATLDVYDRLLGRPA
jgi:glycosyltransferase involved in cell wall biosynthesis